MDPEARFVTPTPALRPAGSLAVRRLKSASSLLNDRPPTRSKSTGPPWKRFFGKTARAPDSPPPSSRCSEPRTTACGYPLPESRPSSFVGARRTRDMSPESLRRFLVEDAPLPPDPAFSQKSALKLSPVLPEEADDDDDNFATSAVSETQPFGTVLSPPPYQRAASADTVPKSAFNLSSLTLTTHAAPVQRPDRQHEAPCRSAETNQLPRLNTADADVPKRPSAMSSSGLPALMSPQSSAEESPTYDSNDDDIWSSSGRDDLSHCSRRSLATRAGIKVYSLPSGTEGGKASRMSSRRVKDIGTAPVLANDDADIAISRSNFLGEPIDTGLDDFVNELGLLVNFIGNDLDGKSELRCVPSSSSFYTPTSSRD
ncbi:hypothetical protein AAL_06958 [Moelleriella libera RCEF 2490]|uniref:Uncharacterized protein n=1 Tax=Moelleriella libera RCEF 2490 TaxID=1081109 RepID=A0A167Y160_9HYPO|nr:hypothetical protein AAL_06958 [Moelleriella libera RCEF 2490]